MSKFIDALGWFMNHFWKFLIIGIILVVIFWALPYFWNVGPSCAKRAELKIPSRATAEYEVWTEIDSFGIPRGRSYYSDEAYWVDGIVGGVIEMDGYWVWESGSWTYKDISKQLNDAYGKRRIIER